MKYGTYYAKNIFFKKLSFLTHIGILQEHIGIFQEHIGILQEYIGRFQKENIFLHKQTKEASICKTGFSKKTSAPNCL